MTSAPAASWARSALRDAGSHAGIIILCADDYAMTQGISRAIGELAAARRLSATSVIVTSPHWPAVAPRLLAHRGHLSIGLHLNLTWGAPLGSMPRLAPHGRFPSLATLLARASMGLLDAAEIAAEIQRQLDALEAGLRAAPDHIDSHQHVHVLPVVRHALIEQVAHRYPRLAPLLRDPSDSVPAILARRMAATKALLVKALALGFGDSAHARGLRTNDSFAGFSHFDVRAPFQRELSAALTTRARRHLIMCHPGHPDTELANIDPVVERRAQEYAALMSDLSLPERIWRPARDAQGPPLDWSRSDPG
jgi:predicted glycoside hydrolase/deacetylase ChbG (UPF0249 family)